MAQQIFVQFWGTRGSVPTPGPKTLKYGGNTACLEIRIDNQIIIIDAGTGLRFLGKQMQEEFGGQPICAHIFITHTHWDHVQGFPFFLPLFYDKNKFIIHADASIINPVKRILLDQMNPEYFPVAFHDIRADISFNGFDDNKTLITDDILVESCLVNHTTKAYAYKISYAGKSIVFITDNEPFNDFEPTGKDKPLIEFASNCTMLICDAQYTVREYEHKKGWGHSSIAHALNLALAANAENLYLFHHDPDHGDQLIDAQVAYCQNKIQHGEYKFSCYGAQENKRISIDV